MEYWSWWMGGVGLALVPILYGSARFGMSTAFERVLFRRETIDLAEAKYFSKNRELLSAALSGKSPDSSAILPIKIKANKRWWAWVFLFLGVFSGGLLDALIRGDLDWSWSLSATHESLFGLSWGASFVLLGGGYLVGLGTRLAGGCTSGHGLSGVSSFQGMSLLATAVFFGFAILTSYFIQYLVS